MVRVGRIPASDLGLGTITGFNPTATRRVIYFNEVKLATGTRTLLLTQGQTKLDQIDAVVVTARLGTPAKATGSLVFLASTKSGGSVLVREQTKTINRQVRLNIMIIGTPDTRKIP